jgi:hypothetical protein
MESYKNLGGNSNVMSYELNDGEVTVKFGDGSIYLYTNRSTGAENINEMHRLARAGHGLNSFIGRVVRKAFARKIQ